MNISIIGAGNMGEGIGTRVVAARYNLTVFDKNKEKAKELATSLGSGVGVGDLEKQIDGDMFIFALPYPAIPGLLEKYKDQLSGKILVDISNPVDFQTFELLPPPGSSGAEEIAEHLPKNARLVKAFNTTFAGTLIKGGVDGKILDVFIASDDEDAAQTVVRLCEDAGLRGLYVGPLKRARALEEMQLIQMSLQERLGTGWMSAIKILP